MKSGAMLFHWPRSSSSFYHRRSCAVVP